MKLFFMRHGDSVEIGERGVSRDADRTLTNKGRQRSREVAGAFVRIGGVIDIIVSSPLKRAEETAKIVAPVIAPKISVTFSQSLRPAASPARFITELNDLPESSSIFIVGHLPNLTNLMSVLVTGNVSQNFLLKKSGICCITFSSGIKAGHGTLEWLFQPQQLKLLSA